MAWNKQQLTEEQKQAATELFSEWRKSEDFGEQPWAVIDAKGTILKFDRRAVCLGSFNSMKLRNQPESPVLFQMKVNKTLRPHSSIYVSDGFINRYLAWVVRSPMCQQWLCKHTAKDRNAFGIPIALNNVPRNVPLLVSTHVRFFWDVHNRHYHQQIAYVKEHFNCTWSEAFAIGNILGWCPGIGDRSFTIQSWSDCHSPFGANVSLHMWKSYIQGKIPLDYYDSHMVNIMAMNRGIGIEDMFKTNPPYLNHFLLDYLSHFSGEKGRFVRFYKVADFEEIVHSLIKLGRSKI